ncbi:MAG: hypothetical protein AMXMBFR79_19420 [Chitinophagaceae bacterium]
MKQVRKILIAVLLFFCVVIKAKAQVPDTTRYILDSIQPKFSYYIGKPLKVLLDDLKIQPIEYHGVFPVWNKSDTIKFTQTLLEFHTLDERIIRKNNDIKSPAIYIKFAQPIPISKTWFMEGGRFEKRDWDLQKERFFRNYIIGEIAIRGI